MVEFYGVVRGGGSMDMSGLGQRLLDVYKKRLGELPRDKEQILGNLPIVLIYGRPESPAMKSEIMPGLQYLHARSGELFEIALMGYEHRSQYLGDLEELENPAAALYEPQVFASAVRDLETKTTWSYSGQTDFIFVMSSLHMERKYNSIMPEVKFDFSSSVSLCLEISIANKLIPSASWLLEEVTRATDPSERANPVSAVSSALAIRNAKAGFLKWIASLLKIDADALRNVGSSVAVDVRRGT